MPITLQKRSHRIKTSVAIPSDLLGLVKRLTKKYEISVSEYITNVVRSDLEERAQRNEVA
jgi:hypothetical protein